MNSEPVGRFDKMVIKGSERRSMPWVSEKRIRTGGLKAQHPRSDVRGGGRKIGRCGHQRRREGGGEKSTVGYVVVEIHQVRTLYGKNRNGHLGRDWYQRFGAVLKAPPSVCLARPD